MDYSKMSDDELMNYLDSTNKTQTVNNNTANQNNSVQQKDYSKMSDEELMNCVDTYKKDNTDSDYNSLWTDNLPQQNEHPIIDKAKEYVTNTIVPNTQAFIES